MEKRSYKIIALVIVSIFLVYYGMNLQKGIFDKKETSIDIGKNGTEP